MHSKVSSLGWRQTWNFVLHLKKFYAYFKIYLQNVIKTCGQVFCNCRYPLWAYCTKFTEWGLPLILVYIYISRGYIFCCIVTVGTVSNMVVHYICIYIFTQFSWIVIHWTYFHIHIQVYQLDWKIYPLDRACTPDKPSIHWFVLHINQDNGRLST